MIKPFFHICCLVLETVSPLSIATGRDDDLFDNLLVCDANNLPAIPGTSFAGVLRHLYYKKIEPFRFRAGSGRSGLGYFKKIRSK
jgi:CRISPR/Cas system CMR subunit Cmr4 (Cas7 group RAMP superfamily)